MLTTTTKYLVPAIFLLLTACAVPSKQKSPMAGDQLNQTCQNLKQEIIRDSVNNMPDELGHSPTQQARMYKEYDKYHCDAVLKKKVNTTGKHITTNTQKLKKAG